MLTSYYISSIENRLLAKNQASVWNSKAELIEIGVTTSGFKVGEKGSEGIYVFCYLFIDSERKSLLKIFVSSDGIIEVCENNIAPDTTLLISKLEKGFSVSKIQSIIDWKFEPNNFLENNVPWMNTSKQLITFRDIPYWIFFVPEYKTFYNYELGTKTIRPVVKDWKIFNANTKEEVNLDLKYIIRNLYNDRPIRLCSWSNLE